MLSICFYSRRGFKLIRRLRMKEDQFYLNFFPYQRTYMLKDDCMINVFVYRGKIENADILVEKLYAIDIIDKLLITESTLNMIKFQRVSFHQERKHYLINLLKIYNILKKYPNNIRSNVLIYGSCILTAYGLRGFNDVDIYIRASCISDIDKLQHLLSKLEGIRGIRVDITVESMLNYWKSYWPEWQIEWSRLAGISGF